MQLLTKFETKSNRVKGVAFHPTRPWILSSLHNGSIQLWDYRMGTLLERFDEHVGPVRGVAFHPTQPLFVSGGDDQSVKVWSHKTRRCLYTLNGHFDYVRTVQFHHEQPWIASSSDDKTARIWNWQSRQLIAVLPGHENYVMSALFHPKDDLLITASMDATIRVWDLSGLKRSGGGPGSGFGGPGGPGGAANSALRAQHVIQQQILESPLVQRTIMGQADIFGFGDVVVKHILEGHHRGVNWATFHPTLPLIVSCGDDYQVKVWRMNESRAWELDTCRGHYKNVSCAVFHPRADLILSNAEDKTLRVWDSNKRNLLQTFRRESDRYWILAAHPEINLFAAGHDSGLIVFKLERERPPHTIHHNQQLLYVKGGQIHSHDLATGSDSPRAAVRTGSSGSYLLPYRTLSYNGAERLALATSHNDSGTYEIYRMPADGSSALTDSTPVHKGSGAAAVWISRNRFAVLDSGKLSIQLKDLSNRTTKTIKQDIPVNHIFEGPGSSILIATQNTVSLYDTQQDSVVGSLPVGPIKYVSWSPDSSVVALIAKHTVTLATSSLRQICHIHETIRIKSGAWDASGVFLYTTLNHIKFLLPDAGADTGTIRTLDQPVYLTQIRGRDVHCLDREGKTRVIAIDPTEYQFKLALARRQYDQVVSIVRSAGLVGQSIIAYLQKKGFAEIAMHFVKDPAARFDLALACANLDVALEAAKSLDNEDHWLRLAREATNAGNSAIAELALQRTQNTDKLAFQYIINGSVGKLKRMMRVAEKQGDQETRFHAALLLGDVEERIKLLRENGQPQLAYMVAKTHGLDDVAAGILAAAGVAEDDVANAFPSNPKLLKPLTPKYALSGNAEQIDAPEANWPALNVSSSIFASAFARAASAAAPTAGAARSTAGAGAGAGAAAAGVSAAGSAMSRMALDDEADDAELGAGGWGDEDLGFGDEGAAGGAAGDDEFGLSGGDDDDELQLDLGSGWGGDDDDIMKQLDEDAASAAAAKVAETFVAPSPGVSEREQWARRSQLAVDHIAAGSYASAMALLNSQVGAVNFEPLRPLFNDIFEATSASYGGAPGLAPLPATIRRNTDSDTTASLPVQLHSAESCLEGLQQAYRAFTGGKLAEANTLFRSLLHRLLFVVVPDTASETGPRGKRSQAADEVLQMINICREYLAGLSLETARRGLPASAAARGLELAAYFTHSQLQGRHSQIALRSAMIQAFKHKNFLSASGFAQRLLDLAPPQATVEEAKKIQTVCARTSRDEVAVNYDGYNPFVVCSRSQTPIYRGSPKAECPLCKASYKPEFAGSVCDICLVAEIGAKATGLQVSNSH